MRRRFRRRGGQRPGVTISPNVGLVGGGLAVTIHGHGFLSGATAILFGADAATDFVVVSDNVITCTTPAHAAGSVVVTISGMSAPATTFGYYATPVVSSVAPLTGSPDGGVSVTITGTGFTDATYATFDGDLLTSFVVVNSTTITGVTPAHAAGLVDVVVFNPATSGTKADAFTYIDALFFVDLSALAAGKYAAATFLADTGLTFTRSTASTVQTSASALLATPGVNEACVGSHNGTDIGLVIQQNVQNVIGAPADTSPRDLNVAWTPGASSVITSAYADSPNGGTGCSRANVSSGGYAPYTTVLGSTARYVLSSWQRSKDAGSSGSMQQEINDGTPSSNDIATLRAASDTWGRLVSIKGGLNGAAGTVCDGRDFSAAGGETARDRDVLVDYIQYEAGDFPTEAIPTGATRRANDVLSYTPGSALIAGTGQIKFSATLVPKHASTMQAFYDGAGGAGASAAWYLFSWGANGQNYAKIKDSDKKLYVKLANGVEAVSSNAIAFAQYDVLDVYLEAGAGLPSVAMYRRNGGSWVNLSLGTMSDTPAPGSGAVGLLYNDNGSATADSGQFPCWLQALTFYDEGGLTLPDVSFDPATLPLTGWWSADRQPFTASPWVGEASAGSSATHDLTEATNPPAASSGAADFDGTNDQLGSATANNVFFGAHGSFACLFYADSAPAPTGVAYGDGSLFGDWGNAETTFGFTSDGICGAVYATTYKRIDIACGTGDWHLAQFKWDGTNLKGRLDSGTWSSIVAGDYTPSAPGAIFVGRSYAAAIFFDGKIREVMTADSALSDGDFDDIVSYVNETYGLAL